MCEKEFSVISATHKANPSKQSLQANTLQNKYSVAYQPDLHFNVFQFFLHY